MLAWFLRYPCNYYLRKTRSTCKTQLVVSAASFVSDRRFYSVGEKSHVRTPYVLTKQTFHGHTSPTHIAPHTRALGPSAQHTTLRLLVAWRPSGRTAPKPRRKIHWHTKIRQNHRISAAQIHGKVHETGAVRSGTWRGRGAAHAPASILVRPPRGYHCNMAATHFLAEVLRWFLLLISTTAFFVTVPNSCGFTALILIHILMENRER